jgi:hypothetical protein
MRGELTRGKLTVIVAAGTVAFGAAAWLLLGPVWAIAGVLVGPLLTIIILAGVRTFTGTDAATALVECLTCEAGWLAEIDLPGEALPAVHEATGICQDKLPWQRVPSCAARAMLLEGELLCGQDRHREAARLLVKGWHMAAGQDQEDARRDAVPAIKAAYRADPDHFSAVWRAETGAGPPDWLSP